MQLIFGPDGKCRAQNPVSPCPDISVLLAAYGGDALVFDQESPPYPDDVWPAIVATVADGVVNSITVPEYQSAPSSPSNDTAQRLASLETAVAQNLLASPHDRRWLAQKEAAKGVMAWMQSNPTCTQADVEAQVEAAMQAATPGQPVVIAPAGLVQSYAEEAHTRGYIATADFDSLRALVAASSAEQLRQMLAVL